MVYIFSVIFCFQTNLNSEVSQIDGDDNFHIGKYKKGQFCFHTIFELLITKVKIIAILFESKLKTQTAVYIRVEITFLSAYIIDFVILGRRCIHKQDYDALLKRTSHITLFQALRKHPNTVFTYNTT